MTTMKPCPRCHSTEHLHIEIVDDYLNDTLSAKVTCTECNIFTQRHYVFNGTTDNERPSDVQLTREVIEQWNESCDYWKGVFNNDRNEAMPVLR
nr:MAG TPA: restriction alleviation protein [Caudoviricetes sp.]